MTRYEETTVKEKVERKDIGAEVQAWFNSTRSPERVEIEYVENRLVNLKFVNIELGPE